MFVQHPAENGDWAKILLDSDQQKSGFRNLKLPRNNEVDMDSEKIRDDLISIAAALIRGVGVPSPYRPDWPKRITWAEIHQRLETTEEWTKDLGCKIRDIVDRLPTKSSKE